MTTYKNIETFRKAVKEKIAWSDYMKIGNRVYKIYEYGDRYPSGEYAYFINKKTHDAIKIDYVLPRTDRKTGIKSNYQFIDLTFIPNMEIWREDTL